MFICSTLFYRTTASTANTKKALSCDNYDNNVAFTGMNTTTTELEATGERVIVDLYQKTLADYLLFLLHEATYEFCKKYVADATVLDYGCGSGYGTASLANECRSIVGVDVEKKAVEYAQRLYKNQALSYQQIDPGKTLPFADEHFGVVLSLQVLEHVPDPKQYLLEIKRLLNKGGKLILCTPNRETRLMKNQKPWNRFHVTEFSTAQLNELLASVFSSVNMYQIRYTGDAAAIEQARIKKLQLVTLPFTFPGSPDWWRINGLSLLRHFKKNPAQMNISAATLADWRKRFGSHSVVIQKDGIAGSCHLAVCQK